MQYLKRCNKSDSVWSFRVGFMVAIRYASNILHASFLFGTLQITFQLNIWVILSFKSLDGFDFSHGALCSLHLVSTIAIVSATYDSPQLHIPS